MQTWLQYLLSLDWGERGWTLTLNCKVAQINSYKGRFIKKLMEFSIKRGGTISLKKLILYGPGNAFI